MRVETLEEMRLFALGERNYNSKKEFAKTALQKQTPNDEESDMIHAMWVAFQDYTGVTCRSPWTVSMAYAQLLDHNIPRHKPKDVVYMDKTNINTNQIMQPQYRNRHHFMIFGGFLLKQTFELAFCCAASVSHSRPIFLSLDPSTFANPVPVGSVLHLKAMVAYTDPPLANIKSESKTPNKGSDIVNSESEGNAEGFDARQKNKYTKVQIRVESRVRNIEHSETKPTGEFHYTFLVKKDIKVVPRTYSEFMIWVDARRRAERVTQNLAGAARAGDGLWAQEEANMERVIE